MASFASGTAVDLEPAEQEALGENSAPSSETPGVPPIGLPPLVREAKGTAATTLLFLSMEVNDEFRFGSLALANEVYRTSIATAGCGGSAAATDGCRLGASVPRDV